jgi:hypothetical protein
LAGSRLNPQLGDKHLNPEEEVIRQREDLRHDISGREAYGQKDIEKAERSEGPRLYYSTLLKKMKNIYPHFLIKDGIPGNVAVYRPKTKDEIERDGYDMIFPQWRNEHKYVTGFPKEWIPEWGHYVNDTDGIALREDPRGWRTVHIAMVKQRLVTYAASIAEFGEPIHDQRSKYFFEQLAPYMNEEKTNAGRKITLN